MPKKETEMILVAVPINPGVKNSNFKLQSHYIGNETNYYTINNQHAGSQTTEPRNHYMQTVFILDMGKITQNITAGKCYTRQKCKNLKMPMMKLY